MMLMIGRKSTMAAQRIFLPVLSPDWMVPIDKIKKMMPRRVGKGT